MAFGDYIQAWSLANNTNLTTITATVATPFATSGNLLIAKVSVKNGGDAFTTPTGWNLISDASSGASGFAWYWRFATGTSADDFTPVWTDTGLSVACVTEWEGSFDATPLDASNENESGISANSGALSTNAATASTTDGLAVAFLGARNDDDWWTGDDGTGLSLSNSFTLRHGKSNIGGSNDPGVAIGSLVYSSSGSKTTTWSSSVGYGIGYAAIALFKKAGGGATEVVPADATQGQSLDNVTLTQHNVLAVQDITQGQSLDNVTLTQANILAVQELSQAQTLDNVTLTQAHILAVADVAQAQTLDNVTLTQAGTLAVADMAQSQTLDNLTLTQANILALADITQAQTLDNVTLTVAGSLAIQALLQSQSIDNVTLTQANILAVQDLAQGQTLDNLSLVQHYVLAIQDILQAQSLDNLTLSVGSDTIAPADLTQGQSTENVTLTQYHILAVDDLTQSQILDAVTLGGLVIGELRGTIVMYALVDGQVTVYPLFDATPTTIH